MEKNKQILLQKGLNFVLEIISTVHTTRDLKYVDNTDENAIKLLKHDRKNEAMDAYSKLIMKKSIYASRICEHKPYSVKEYGLCVKNKER